MEIRVNIPINDWKEPTEVREEVVQGICESFLAENAWTTFHPHSEGMYCQKTSYIFRHKGEKIFKGFTSKPFDSEVNVRFNSAELKTAVECLKKSGYYIHEVYEYRTWLGYVCSKYPTISKGRRVEEINLTSDF